jgi:hypothetical protein
MSICRWTSVHLQTIVGVKAQSMATGRFEKRAMIPDHSDPGSYITAPTRMGRMAFS